MRLTSKGRYAVSAMVDLAMHQQEGPVTLAAIAERQFISLSYLEQLFRRLREGGLVRSVRGPGGGYLLNDDPANISVSDVIRAVAEEDRGGPHGLPEQDDPGVRQVVPRIAHDGGHVLGLPEPDGRAGR